MAQNPVNVKLTVPTKTGRPGVVQMLHTNSSVLNQSVMQQNSPSFKSHTAVRSFVPASLGIPINTNTATQYVRKPAEMTVISSGNTFVAAPMAQPFTLYGNSVMAINPNIMQSLSGPPGISTPAMSQLGGPGAIMSSSSSMANSRKPCNCTKSHCLKLYCECFAQGQLCQNCNCHNCMNNLAYEEERGRAIKMTLERNPTAFHPKIGRGEGERKHTKGCNCKRSGCLKNYCECYEAKISCSDLCRCQGCRNTEDSVERRSLMRLAAMGSLRSRQPAAFKKHLIKPPSETLPHVFFTWEVIEATTCCLLAQAEEAERHDLAPAAQERILLEEFGRILEHVIDSASKAQVRAGGSLPGPDSDGDQSLLNVPAAPQPNYQPRVGSASAVGVATAAAAAADVLLRNDEDDDEELMRQMEDDDDEDEGEDQGELDDDMFDEEMAVVSGHHHHRQQTRHSNVRSRGPSTAGSRGHATRIMDEVMSDEEPDDDEDDDDDVLPDTRGHTSSALISQKYRHATMQQQQPPRSRSQMLESRYMHHSRRSRSHQHHDPDSII